MVIWIIGLSGAGKSVVGKRLSDSLKEMDRAVVFMDGDIFREIMGNDLGHSIQDRRKNADRICRFCQYLNSENIDVIFPILSIFPESRQWNRKNIPDYYEVFLEVNIKTVKKRDSKGLYKKALNGEITNVVGVDIPFPAPENPDIVINNDKDRNDFSDIVNLIVNDLKSKKLI